MKQNPLKTRLVAVAVFFGLLLLLFFFQLYNYQVVHGSEYRAKSISSNATTEVVEASRGILTDRNGKTIISNRLAYTLTLSEDAFHDEEEENQAILRLTELCRNNDTAWVDTLPLTQTEPFSYLPGTRDNETFLDFLQDHRLSPAALSAEQLLERLRTVFHVDPQLSALQARQIVGVRYELSLRDSYVFAEDVSVALISQIVDGHFTGVTTGTSSARVYNTSCAAHILGRVARIYAEDWESYRDKGYSMDALVGKGGVEEAFEEYLHGTNGTRLITTDDSGRITGMLYTRDPQPGNTVALTLDIDLQQDVENALAKTIRDMQDEDSEERGGAAAVIRVGTGEVLALASYPSFDQATYLQNYESLVEDHRLPMFNRAINGTYAPGSTFKPCTAIAALESGIITPYTTILDRGIYTYYSYPQPMCWLYDQYGGTHGYLNVTEAITESCNYFFYEVGRLTGIRTIDDYATQFGLGQYTGIEVGDSKGSLASPEYAEANELDWTDGQTITAAIGQSYNLFTPLQLANYVATLASGGRHYAAHLLKDVKSYDNSQLVYVYDEEPLNTVEISEANLQAVLTGMHELTTRGSVSTQFSNCVVSAGAKTGTAQVGTALNNGVFVAFAPYEKPEIALAVVIEKGGSGAALADTAVEIINAYFSRDDAHVAVTGENTLLK